MANNSFGSGFQAGGAIAQKRQELELSRFKQRQDQTTELVKNSGVEAKNTAEQALGAVNSATSDESFAASSRSALQALEVTRDAQAESESLAAQNGIHLPSVVPSLELAISQIKSLQPPSVRQQQELDQAVNTARAKEEATQAVKNSPEAIDAAVERARKIEVAKREGKPVKPDVQNFINSDTGETFAIDLTADNASQMVEQALKSGFQEFNQSVQASSPGELDAGKVSRTEAKNIQREIDTLTRGEKVIGELLEQIDKTPNVAGTVGALVSAVTTASGVLGDFARSGLSMFGIDAETANEALTQIIRTEDMDPEVRSEFDEALQGSVDSAQTILKYIFARTFNPSGRLLAENFRDAEKISDIRSSSKERVKGRLKGMLNFISGSKTAATRRQKQFGSNAPTIPTEEVPTNIISDQTSEFDRMFKVK